MSLRSTWYIGEALTVFGRRLPVVKAGFTRSELCGWCPRIGREGNSGAQALDHLKVLGFIRRVRTPAGKPPPARGMHYFALTAVGEEAAKAAVSEATRSVRAANARRRGAERRGVSDFAQRLWTLLRIRRTLTAYDAAPMLVDTDDIAVLERGRTLAGRWLLSWSRHYPEAVQTSARRIENRIRYVLVNDLGPVPPVTTLRPPSPSPTVSASQPLEQP